MRSLRDFGISRRYNNEESPTNYKNTVDRSRGRESLYNSRQEFPSRYINNTPQQRYSTNSFQPNYYTAAPRESVTRNSRYIQPFNQKPETFSRVVVNQEEEKYSSLEYKRQIEKIRNSEMQYLIWNLIMLGGTVLIPALVLFSWSIGILLFALGGFSLYIKSSIGIAIPSGVIILIDFVLIALTIDSFISFDPGYEIVNKLIFSIPMSVYILSKTWEDLLISKIPVDNWEKPALVRVLATFIETWKIYLNLNSMLLVLLLMLIGGMYELLFNGASFESFSNNLGTNILVKFILLFPLFFTVKVSEVLEKYTFNGALSQNYKELKLYLWMLKVKDLRYDKIYLKIIKHMSQIYVSQKDLFDRELPIRSRSEQYYSDLILNFFSFYLDQILTRRLPEEKQAAFRGVRILKSSQTILDDLTIYFQKMNSVVGLNLQNVRIRQYLELTTGICNILVKSKSYKTQFNTQYDMGNEVCNKLSDVHRYYKSIMDQKLLSNDSCRRLLNYMEESLKVMSSINQPSQRLGRSSIRSEGSNPADTRKFKLFR